MSEKGRGRKKEETKKRERKITIKRRRKCKAREKGRKSVVKVTQFFDGDF